MLNSLLKKIKKIAAHKLILCSSSQFFCRIFSIDDSNFNEEKMGDFKLDINKTENKKKKKVNGIVEEKKKRRRIEVFLL